MLNRRRKLIIKEIKYATVFGGMAMLNAVISACMLGISIGRRGEPSDLCTKALFAHTNIFCVEVIFGIAMFYSAGFALPEQLRSTDVGAYYERIPLGMFTGKYAALAWGVGIFAPSLFFGSALVNRVNENVFCALSPLAPASALFLLLPLWIGLGCAHFKCRPFFHDGENRAPNVDQNAALTFDASGAHLHHP